jgi:hypothetical protein
MSVTIASPEGQWISGRAARKLTGRGVYAIHKLALVGRIRTRLEPGSPIQYHRDDVLALVDAPRPEPPQAEEVRS